MRTNVKIKVKETESKKTTKKTNKKIDNDKKE